MADLTVSSNVDTMLQAADNAAIRTAIGAGDVTPVSYTHLTLPTLLLV